MDLFAMLLFFAGIVAFLVGAVGLIIVVLRKKSKKSWIVTLCSGLAAVIIGIIISATTGAIDRSSSSSAASSSKVSKKTETKEATNTSDDDSSSDASSSDESSSSSQSKSSSSKAFNIADYQTGITYDQLARTPNDYKNKNVTFTGKVIQVIDGDSETDLRVAINGDSDNIVLVGFDPSIMNGARVLEDDKITFYGMSLGTTTYKSTIGGKITVPLVAAVKIEDSGKAPDDYGYTN